jgi:hypothetical protein
MDTSKMFEGIDHHRRRFFGTAAITIAAAQFGMVGSADAQTKPAPLPAIKPGCTRRLARSSRSTNTGTTLQSSFGRLLRRNGTSTMPHSIAASFENPDHVAIVIHNYRWRLGLAEGERKYDDLERRLAEAPVITVPTITLEGDANGAPHPDGRSYARKFSGKYSHRIIKGGVGHNLP